jgi:Gpi18-like mannosyltransferase
MGKETIKEKANLIKNKSLKYYRLCGLYVLKFFQKYYLQIIMIVATIVCLIARYQVVTHPTNDLVGYILNGWLKEIEEKGFSYFYKVDADYSPLYLLMLGFISFLPNGELIEVSGYSFYKNNMIYIKSVYFIFTIILAFGIYLIIKHLTKNKILSSIGYIIIIALPTVFINSAIWGNADVIYATFLIYAFYFVLKDKAGLGFFFWGLAFANKLQAVFLLPFLVLLILNRKIKLHKILYGGLSFFLSVVPCYFAGASFTEPFAYIGKELNGYRKLTLGCPNMWQLMEFKGDVITNNCMWIGLLLIGVVFAILYIRHIDLNSSENRFKVGILLIMTTIFFLPYMHERYFYLIDCLVVVYALIDKRKFYFIPLMQISSGIAYYHYLSGYYFIQPWGENSVHIAAFINLFVLCVIFYDVLKLEHRDFSKEDIISLEDEINKIKEND